MKVLIVKRPTSWVEQWKLVHCPIYIHSTTEAEIVLFIHCYYTRYLWKRTDATAPGMMHAKRLERLQISAAVFLFVWECSIYI